MKVQELLESKTTMEDLVTRLERVGGQIYGELTKGELTGKLGVNGKGKHKVYFAFYPDGSSQRFEHLPTKDDLKAGWKAQELRDPETVKVDTDKADRERKEKQKEDKFEEDIHLSFKELSKVCTSNGIHIHVSEIADAYVDGDSDRGVRKIKGRDVAWALYTITLKNQDWSGEDDKDNVELHDPVHVKIWRDSKYPDILHAEQTDL